MIGGSGPDLSANSFPEWNFGTRWSIVADVSPDLPPDPTEPPAPPPPARVTPKHHGLVRLTHWANVPLLFLLIATGLAIYWAAPVFGDLPPWLYDRLSLGTRQLAPALRLHWLLAYLFMLNGMLYAIGLIAGGGWRALVPRRTDGADALAMLRFYAGTAQALVLRRPAPPHPPVRSKYNALQRGAYFTMPLVGLLVVLSGWAMHKPSQLGWLERAFGGYDGARIVHFACMIVLGSFVVPHVILVVADGWDTFRSMITGWSKRVRDDGEEPAIDVRIARLRGASRRAFLAFGAGAIATAAGAWWLLPDRTKARLAPGAWRDRLDTMAARVGLTPAARERALDGVLTFDDDVAEALYSVDRRVRTYARSAVTSLRVNYHGRTPDAAALEGWTLEVTGLASGGTLTLTAGELAARLPVHEQGTRLVCVEGWSAVAWWGGHRFADFLAAFPPARGMRWASIRSALNLDARGRPDPYYVSLDLATARHPQTLLATRQDGRPLSLGHGAPLRLVAPVKLGLKNIKAITSIEYVAAEPADYWNERGYSKYDGL